MPSPDWYSDVWNGHDYTTGVGDLSDEDEILESKPLAQDPDRLQYHNVGVPLAEYNRLQRADLRLAAIERAVSRIDRVLHTRSVWRDLHDLGVDPSKLRA